MKRHHAKQQRISDDEQLARYAYVLGNVPHSVADKAYAAAFARLPDERRREIVHELIAQLPSAPQRSAPLDPPSFAVLMRDLQARAAIVGIPGAAALAAEFVASPPVAAYFTTGAGSVSMDHQPPWVHELGGHETAPIDGGRAHHRPGVDFGDWYGTGRG